MTDIIEEKTCIHCNETKLLTDFYMMNKYVHRYTCKSCDSIYQKERRKFLKNNPNTPKRKITKVQTITIIADDNPVPLVVSFKECTTCHKLLNVDKYRYEGRLGRIIGKCIKCQENNFTR